MQDVGPGDDHHATSWTLTSPPAALGVHRTSSASASTDESDVRVDVSPQATSSRCDDDDADKDDNHDDNNDNDDSDNNNDDDNHDNDDDHYDIDDSDNNNDDDDDNRDDDDH